MTDTAVETDRASETLYILGAMGWRHAPPDCEVWGLNDCRPPAWAWDSFRVGAWFQMHPEASWRAGRNGQEHIAWLQESHHFPIYMQAAVSDVPASVAYPIDEVSKLWPATLGTGPIFSDSFCYMLGLAILHGYHHVELYGAYLLDPVEAWLEPEGVAYWLAIAAHHGVRVASNGRLLKPFRYGYEPRLPDGLMPESVAAHVIAIEQPEARTLLNDYRRQRQAAWEAL